MKKIALAFVTTLLLIASAIGNPSVGNPSVVSPSNQGGNGGAAKVRNIETPSSSPTQAMQTSNPKSVQERTTIEATATQTRTSKSLHRSSEEQYTVGTVINQGDEKVITEEGLSSSHQKKDAQPAGSYDHPAQARGYDPGSNEQQTSQRNTAESSSYPSLSNNATSTVIVTNQRKQVDSEPVEQVQSSNNDEGGIYESPSGQTNKVCITLRQMSDNTAQLQLSKQKDVFR